MNETVQQLASLREDKKRLEAALRNAAWGAYEVYQERGDAREVFQEVRAIVAKALEENAK